MFKSVRNLSDDANGAMMVLVVVCLLALVFLGALMVDLSKAEFTTRGIQRSVDAASLAAATELVLTSDSDIDRWKNSKRAVLGALRQNPIFASYQFPNTSDSSHHQGAQDSCESTGQYRSQIYNNGEMSIEIERGNYFDGEPSTFTSLEHASTCNASANPLPNAVRVTVVIQNYANLFGKVGPFNQARFDTLSRTAIGAHIH